MRPPTLGATLAALVILASCGSSNAGTGRLEGRVALGPTCPDEPFAPSDRCRDRPLADASVRIVRDGQVVETVTTNREGRFRVDLEASTYRLEPQPVAGALGTPAPRAVSVAAGKTTAVALRYDSGIRGRPPDGRGIGASRRRRAPVS
jgi:hypothetical protein